LFDVLALSVPYLDGRKDGCEGRKEGRIPRKEGRKE
jgi:hypothetical protein